MGRIDHDGYYPREVMTALGAAGAYQAHLHDTVGHHDFGTAIAAMTETGRFCGATSFMVWCQDVCGLYIQQSGNQVLIEKRLARHASGATLGGTGMSNPMKTFAQIETMLLRGRRVAGGYLVNGTLPWVSNIGPGHYRGAVFAIGNSSNSGAGAAVIAPREVMFLLECDAPGALRKRCPEFSAMEGTNTFSVRLTDYFVAIDDIIADPVRPFIARIRAAFVLLQTGMALGVVQGAIDSIWRVEQTLGHVNQFLDDRPDQLQDELDDLTSRIMHLAKTPYEECNEYLLDVLDIRAHGSELSLRAAQSALLHQGARGYLMDSEPQRRIREAHFVAIVTPALKHLRKEMARIYALPQPA